MSQFESYDQKPEPLEVVSLPELRATDIDTRFADVEVLPADELAEYPELRLYGEPGDFAQTYEQGRLTVQQLDNPDYNSTMIVNSGIVVQGSGSYVTQIVGDTYVHVSGGRRTIGDRLRSAFRGPSETVIQQYADGSRYVNGVRQDESTEAASDGPKVRKVQPVASLLLPAGISVELHDITTGSGDVDARSLTARQLKLVTRSGSLALHGAHSGSVELETSSGDMTVAGVYASQDVKIATRSGTSTLDDIGSANLEILSSSGDVVLRDAECKGNIRVEGSSSELELFDLVVEGASFSTSSGDIKVAGIKSGLSASVVSRSGEIRLRKAAAYGWNVESSSGDVSAKNLTSETPVTITSRSGDVDVQDSGAPTWTIRTSSGDITTKRTEGQVDARTNSGDKRIGK